MQVENHLNISGQNGDGLNVTLPRQSHGHAILFLEYRLTGSQGTQEPLGLWGDSSYWGSLLTLSVSWKQYKGFYVRQESLCFLLTFGFWPPAYFSLSAWLMNAVAHGWIMTHLPPTGWAFPEPGIWRIAVEAWFIPWASDLGRDLQDGQEKALELQRDSWELPGQVCSLLSETRVSTALVSLRNHSHRSLHIYVGMFKPSAWVNCVWFRSTTLC